MTEVQKALVEQVRFLMSDAGITQKDLARRVGVTEKHLSQMLNGKVEGSLSTWQRLLDGGRDAAVGVHQVRMETSDVAGGVEDRQG